MTRDQMIVTIRKELKGLSNRLEEEDYTHAVNDAERETGWSLPITNDTKIKWFKERAKRHIFFMLLSESAHKFKFKQYNLQHRFDHYKSLIAQMDEDWKTFIDEELLLLEGTGAFGSQIDAGFQYDEFGRDTTYTDSNLVQIHPTTSEKS